MEKTPLWEDILLIVSILMLWPAAFKRLALMSNIFVFIAFIVAFIILVRRLKRWHSLKQNGNKTK
ncbi:MAG: hypothetical protein NC830_01320 [Candidatus Omnitrophica bacterium]|nr:hypothetical protein [Candidatus Omnitrophota bacterium]